MNQPILILGCSFAYGHMLNIEDTFGYKLTKLTNRMTYNRAFDYGWGFHNSYYMFKRQDFYESLPNNIDTIIYVYIPDHINRALGVYMEDFNDKNYESLRYVYKDGKFYKFSFWSKNPLFNLNCIKLFKKFIYLKKIESKKFDKIEFCEKFFIEIRNEAEKHWEKVQFIILNYSYDNDELMEKLEKDNFIIVNLSELTDVDLFNESYQVQFNDDHPNKKAWDIITPSLIKKLNL